MSHIFAFLLCKTAALPQTLVIVLVMALATILLILHELSQIIYIFVYFSFIVKPNIITNQCLQWKSEGYKGTA